MGTMRYKPSDKVRIKSLDWYNRYTNGTEVNCKHYPFSCHMKKYCGQIMTISIVGGHSYGMIEDDGAYSWTDEMIEGLVEEETKPNVIEEAKTYWDSIKDAWICPKGYQFVDENGNVINATKIVLEKKKKEYPKTYEECCKVLGVDPDNYLTIRNVHCYDGEEETVKYERDLLDKFDSLWTLHICRDAYWKIAGEEFNWDNALYYIYTNDDGNVIESDDLDGHNYVLAFPNKASRDAFKENFDKDLETCKELL